MKPYIGAEIILAEPEDRDGTPGYRIEYANGHRSWKPKDVFDGAYREITGRESWFLRNEVHEGPTDVGKAGK